MARLCAHRPLGPSAPVGADWPINRQYVRILVRHLARPSALEWTSGSCTATISCGDCSLCRGGVCRGTRGTTMGFAWMPEGSRHTTDGGTVDDDTGWPYGGGGNRPGAAYPVRRSRSAQSRAGGGVWASAGHRVGRHAQAKGRRPVLASRTVTRLQSLNRSRGFRRSIAETPAGESEVRHQPDRRVAGRGAHAAAWPAMPPR
jgi:hypothetical protein